MNTIGYIYTIKNNKHHRKNDKNNYVYVGSTSLDNVEERFEFHKISARGTAGSKFYTTLRDKGIENFKIKCIETVTGGADLSERDRKKILLKRERFHYDYLLNMAENSNEFIFLNTKKPMLSQEEKDRYKQEHYKLNKEEYIKKALDYYYSNIDAKRAYQRQYDEDNRETIREKHNARNIEVTCECGQVLKKYSLKSHLLSNRHAQQLQATTE